LGKPAILIPLPLSGGGEQDVNAGLMSKVGAAVVLKQTEATPERIKIEILRILNDHALRSSMSLSATTLGRIDAASRLADELLRLVRR